MPIIHVDAIPSHLKKYKEEEEHSYQRLKNLVLVRAKTKTTLTDEIIMLPIVAAAVARQDFCRGSSSQTKEAYSAQIARLRNKASETRQLAQRLRSQKAKDIVARVAADYEHLGKKLEDLIATPSFEDTWLDA